MYDPAVGGIGPTGTLRFEAKGEETVLMLDGEPVLRLRANEFRGAWQWLHDGCYYLDIDVGQTHNFQLRGRLAP